MTLGLATPRSLPYLLSGRRGSAGLDQPLPITRCEERDPVDTCSFPAPAAILSPSPYRSWPGIFPPKLVLCFHRNWGRVEMGGGVLPHRRGLHLGLFRRGWQCLAELFPLLFFPFPRPLPEQHVPLTVFFNTFILCLIYPAL